MKDSSPSGEFWVVTAALLSIQLAQGRSVEELELLATFFTCLADNLALLAGQLPQNPIPLTLEQKGTSDLA